MQIVGAVKNMNCPRYVMKVVTAHFSNLLVVVVCPDFVVG